MISCKDVPEPASGSQHYNEASYSNVQIIEIKAKFHYASSFEANRRQVRRWSSTSFEPVCDQLRTSFEPASIMEFGFYEVCSMGVGAGLYMYGSKKVHVRYLLS